jgi:hypothetical protein
VRVCERVYECASALCECVCVNRGKCGCRCGYGGQEEAYTSTYVPKELTLQMCHRTLHTGLTTGVQTLQFQLSAHDF